MSLLVVGSVAFDDLETPALDILAEDCRERPQQQPRPDATHDDA